MIITSRNNASISNFGGDFRWKSEYPWCIIEFSKKSRKTKKKNDEKTGIFTQNQFSTESIFLYGCNSKTNHCKYLKFSPNFKFLQNLSKTRKFAKKTRSIIIRKILTVVDKIFLALSKYLKILYKVSHMHNFFLLAFEVQILTKIRQNYEYLQIIFLLTTIISVQVFFSPIHFPTKSSSLQNICTNIISKTVIVLNKDI
ncbi:hypothetical protein AGLY_012389 [Aphis glycines]|uniref:Transmembrane protein n=1 Tax=Aphis glycines TaxID=307491 RepID=A0A6G0TC50_APHGL|nr:hypothetical protein AGLY_012389 [Aphis glycines]